MTLYDVRIEVRHTYSDEVEAESEQEAEAEAKRRWYAGEVEWTSPTDTYVIDTRAREQR